MPDHSIKVPRLYKTAAKVAKAVSEGKGSIKQLVYEIKHPNIKAVYALVVNTFQRTEIIDNLFKKSKLLVKESKLDPWLAKILVTELLWGKNRLNGQSKPVTTIQAYEQIFKAHLSDLRQEEIFLKPVEKPRYVRVNTIKISVQEAIDCFREEGWILVKFFENSYEKFLEAVRDLTPEEFMVDFHIPSLLVFPPKTQFYKHSAYLAGKIILQDKASCLPVHILNPEVGSTVLDMCAAPGMKTTHCAALLENKGKIYAVEKGKKRFETLNKLIDSSGATCVTTINEDALSFSDEGLRDVEYVIVDPSCSGSGITDRVETAQQENQQHYYRLEKLAGFQIKLLRYALTRFPKVKRVVYSTCSIYPEENEDVVRQVLETCKTFKLVPAAPFLAMNWMNFGSSEFGDIGNYCLYAKPDLDLTSGFFVAVFERLANEESNQFLNKNLQSLNKKYKQKSRKLCKQNTSQKESKIGQELKNDEVHCRKNMDKFHKAKPFTRHEQLDNYASNVREDLNSVQEEILHLETKGRKKRKTQNKNEDTAMEPEAKKKKLHKRKKEVLEPDEKLKNHMDSQNVSQLSKKKVKKEKL